MSVFSIARRFDRLLSQRLPSEGGPPALVLNADFRPLSYFPLSIWSWQDAVKAVFLDRVNIVSEYEEEVRSPTFSMRLPSVIALKQYVPLSRALRLRGSMSFSATGSPVSIAAIRPARQS